MSNPGYEQLEDTLHQQWEMEQRWLAEDPGFEKWSEYMNFLDSLHREEDES